MASFPWEKLIDRLYIILIVACALFWASRNSDPSKVAAVEQKLDGMVSDINKFGGDVNARIGALERAVIPNNQDAPGAAPRK